jgi:hypothetical protein
VHLLQLGCRIEGRHPVEVIYSRLVGAAVGAPITIVLVVVIRAFATSLVGQAVSTPFTPFLEAGIGGIVGGALGPGVTSTLLRGWMRWLLPALPVVALLVFYFFVLAARLVVGGWPSYGNPDNGTVPGLLLLDVSVFVALATTLFSPALLLFLLPWLGSTTSDGSHARRSCGIFALAYAVWFLTLWLDPGRFLNWYMD